MMSGDSEGGGTTGADLGMSEERQKRLRGDVAWHAAKSEQHFGENVWIGIVQQRGQRRSRCAELAEGPRGAGSGRGVR